MPDSPFSGTRLILTVAACLPYLVFFLLAVRRLLRRPRLTIAGFEKLPGIEAMVTLSDGRQLRGSGTVWHHFPLGKRASTGLEMICSDEWTKQMWKRGHPLEVLRNATDGDSTP